MIRYVFRDDEPLRIKAAGKADPQVFGEALNTISQERGGRLEPEDVVNSARSPNHPLHRHFEWDDGKAAEQYRLDQARSIIRIVRVIDDAGSDGTSRAFQSISDKKGTAYRSITEIKSSSDLQLALLRQAERELDAFLRRYRDLVDICEDVKSAKGKLAARLKKVETRAAA